MQFIPDGPDIPDELLQAHEECRVVFFCGAGISFPAGLPDFKDLVTQIYRRIGTSQSTSEKSAFNEHRYDAVLELLERRLPGGRLNVRKALFDALQPQLDLDGATTTHEALLSLARNRDGTVRLVTTNFDRIFSAWMNGTQSSIPVYAAPQLPIAKKSRWNGLVYLHGLLPERKNDEPALNRIVLTSGDFGLAYLTERWAARFVSDLFSNYVVCFVGYSVNDPVMRYMMDALAADRRLGEATPQAYAFADYDPVHQDATVAEWESKGVNPILYDRSDHSLLHRTLREWAHVYRDGLLGKEAIVVKYAMALPSASTKQDDFVGRMLWALADPTGLPMKRFAELNPAPPLEWLFALDEEYCRQFNAIQWQLAHWLVRYLDEPTLILWISERPGRLHDQLVWLIERELTRIAELEKKGGDHELARISALSPSAIPRPILRPVWRLLLTNRVKLDRTVDFNRWIELVERDGMTPSVRLALRDFLSPKVAIRRPFRPDADSNLLREILDCELVLSSDHMQSLLSELAKTDRWRQCAPQLLVGFQQLLQDALDLRCEIDQADDRNDRSHLDLPSISCHWQNKGFRDWVVLIELLRDAWVEVSKTDNQRAAQVAIGWFALPYPTFKRLAFFAANHASCIAPAQWVDWLLADKAWWLWSDGTKRETFRLLVGQGGTLQPHDQERLEEAILNGPSRAKSPEDVAPDDWDRSIWLRLAKLQSLGALLSPQATAKLKTLSNSNPNWKLAADQHDEFVYWMSGTGDPDFEQNRRIEIAPKPLAELIEWLKRPPIQSAWYQDNWRDTCRRRFLRCALALCALSKQGQWPLKRWREALWAWSEKGQTQRSWRFIGTLLCMMPDHTLAEPELLDAVTWWLAAVSRSLDHNEDGFLVVCFRILDFSTRELRDDEEPYHAAINHPIGHVTEALLNLWFNRKPNDNDGLPPEFQGFFTQICNPSVPRFRAGRILLASRATALFRVDHSWAEKHLIPLFDWETNADEARAAWTGFVASARLHWPLLIALKKPFLDTVHHYSRLGELRKEFARMLTFAALESNDAFPRPEFETAFSALPQEGLDEAVGALLPALEAAGDQTEAYWQNHVQPFWTGVWPQFTNRYSKSIAQAIASLCIAARGEFPAALEIMGGWLRPIDYADFPVRELHSAQLSKRFPNEALKLLSLIIGNPQWPIPHLRECLDDIVVASPILADDLQFVRLNYLPTA